MIQAEENWCVYCGIRLARQGRNFCSHDDCEQIARERKPTAERIAKLAALYQNRTDENMGISEFAQIL